MSGGRKPIVCEGILLVLCERDWTRLIGISPHSLMQGGAHICASQPHLKFCNYSKRVLLQKSAPIMVPRTRCDITIQSAHPDMSNATNWSAQ